jgi:hypothetical protein
MDTLFSVCELKHDLSGSGISLFSTCCISLSSPSHQIPLSTQGTTVPSYRDLWIDQRNTLKILFEIDVAGFELEQAQRRSVAEKIGLVIRNAEVFSLNITAPWILNGNSSFGGNYAWKRR